MTYSQKKRPLFFKTLTFEDSNGTLFLENADCHRVGIIFEASKGTLFLQNADFYGV